MILVAEDGRSASIRSRLFQPGSSRTRASGLDGGMYHDQVVLEDGVWKLWSVDDRRALLLVAEYEGGWSAAKDPDPAPAAAPRRPAGRQTGPALPARHSADRAG